MGKEAVERAGMEGLKCWAEDFGWIWKALGSASFQLFEIVLEK